MKYTHALVAALLGLCACQLEPKRPPDIQTVDPRDDDPFAGTGLSSRDVLETSVWFVQRLRDDLEPAPDGEPWAIFFNGFEKNLSLNFDEHLLGNAIISDVNQAGLKFVRLYLPNEEEEAARYREEHALGERSGDLAPAFPRMPDYLLSGEIREHAVNSALGLSRYMQFHFLLTDSVGGLVWSDVKDIKRREVRHRVYQ